jgi:wyosine [tRNA(Phe)-imidazoG37] synthetase (radical SAM superfamily)
MSKLPIIFDDHLDHSKIELQYFVDTRIGKNTCKAKCEFCWLDKPHLNHFKQEPEEAEVIIKGLERNGFKVVPIVSDSFAENGKYLRSNIFKDNDDWYMGNAAWSSGRPLLQDNYEELLDLCIENNVKTIIMTSHGTEDKSKDFKGLTQPSVVKKATARIKAFSAKRNWEFKVILTFTISRANMTEQHLKEYFAHCEELGADVLRLNRFADKQGIYEHLRLTKEDTIACYKLMKRVYDEYNGNVQLSVSEDFGSWGVEVMGFPAEVGHCVAGEYLFGVVYPDVYVCPVNLTLKVGKIQPDHTIQWNQEVIDQLMEAKKHPEFGGCIGVAYPHSQEIRDYFQDLPVANLA